MLTEQYKRSRMLALANPEDIAAVDPMELLASGDRFSAEGEDCAALADCFTVYDEHAERDALIMLDCAKQGHDGDGFGAAHRRNEYFSDFGL